MKKDKRGYRLWLVVWIGLTLLISEAGLARGQSETMDVYQSIVNDLQGLGVEQPAPIPPKNEVPTPMRSMDLLELLGPVSYNQMWDSTSRAFASVLGSGGGLVDGWLLPPEQRNTLFSNVLTPLQALSQIQIPAPGDNRANGFLPAAWFLEWGNSGRYSNGPHEFPIRVFARMNQWILVLWRPLNIYWRAFKPGYYVAPGPFSFVFSNEAYTITLENNGPLINIADPFKLKQDEMETEYAITGPLHGDDFFPVEDPGKRIPIAWGTWSVGRKVLIDRVADGESGDYTAPIGPNIGALRLWSIIHINWDTAPGFYTKVTEPAALITISAAE